MYPVGQGLFTSLSYTPTVGGSRRCGRFKMIYDCGSGRSGRIPKSLKRSIDELLKHDLGAFNSVDVLVLSHFHWDHVSGLPILLSQVEVEEVLMPYFTPCERLSFLLTELPPYLPWYIRFIADPVTFLLNLGVRRVTLVGRGESEPPIWHREERGRGDDYFTREVGRSRRAGRWYVLPGKRITIPDKFEKDREMASSEDILYRSIYSRENVVYFMERPSPFIAYCDQDERFGQAVALVPFLINKDEGIFDSRAWIDLLKECGYLKDFGFGELGKNCPVTSSQILRMLRKMECIKRIREIYMDTLGKRKLNEHSLVVMVELLDIIKHLDRIKFELLQPLLNRLYLRGLFSYGRGFTAYINIMLPQLMEITGRGFLFTGDFSSDSSMKDAYFERLSSYYLGILERLAFYQVPHHGSSNGWSDKLSNLRTIISAVSYGSRNSYGHPDLDHIRKIEVRSGYLAKITERDSSLISEWLVGKY